MKPVKDNFSDKAQQYQKYRPDYPKELYEHILSYVHKFDKAWDCATGNGQVALELSRHFKQIIATDISEKQLSLAPAINNVVYRTARAERSGLENESIDLITVGQAIHWFDFDLFFKEARRVMQKKAVIAAWTYGTFRVNETINELIDQFYIHVVGPYWDPERKFIDQEYRTIPFPYEEHLTSRKFEIERFWSIQDIEGYLNTWSGVAHYRKHHNENPVDEFILNLKKVWGVEERVVFPIHLRLGSK